MVTGIAVPPLKSQVSSPPGSETVEKYWVLLVLSQISILATAAVLAVVTVRAVTGLAPLLATKVN
ncbi:hypothetical protein ES703_112679 [subsurface metagenome]